ncbi:hypothetical protein ALC62_05115 [Cyphomyrmex costatus]|uniref:Uncharacterized protein n=1 Tax=Cyphomyrmex costatus TaxID=456900 RepID=A0A195CW15_9HYME|nr:hypothetical protein ALC62_05115 [Cyphomyrmex costatus]
MPARYLHGTPRTDSTHSAGRPPCPPLPVLSAHALGPSVGHERERLASLRSRAVRDVTIKVTSLPEYPAQTERRKLDRNPSPFQPQRSPYPPSSAFLSPWRFYGNGARTKSSAISGETKLLVDEGESERERDR